MASRLRQVIEGWLPWFDRRAADAHNDHTEAIRQRSIRARMRAEVERERLGDAVRATAEALAK